MAYDASLGYDPDNIAKYINDATARGDDAEVERLALARYDKINADPVLSKQYGNDVYSQVAKGILKKNGTQTNAVDTNTTQTIQTGQNTPNSFADVMSWIDSVSASQKANAIAGLTNARDSALSNLSAEKSTIAPMYYDQRNQLSAAGNQSSQAMNEFLAQNGLSSAGAGGVLQGRIASGTQGDIANSQISESQAIADILRRTSDVNNQYEQGVASANSQADMLRIQALIDQANSDRQYGLQEAGLTGVLSDGTQTMAGVRNQTEIADAALQKKLDTINQHSNNFAAEIQRIQATPDTDDDALIPYLQSARQMKIAAQESAKSTQAADLYDKAMETFKQLGVASGWVASALGLPEGSKSQDYIKTLYDINKPYYSPNSGGSGGATDNQKFNQLMSIWNYTGFAPAGLEGWGIEQGTPIKEKPTTIKYTTAEDGVSAIRSIMGIKYDPDTGDTVGNPNPKIGYERLTQMLNNKEIDDTTADIIAESIPELKTYIQDMLINADRSGTGGYGR